MSKEELLKQLEEKGLDFDTRALIVDDVLDIINRQLAEPKTENEKLKDIEQRKSFVLYSALCEVLEKRNVENVASMIDQLTKQEMAVDKFIPHIRFNQEYRREICSKCGEIFWVKKTSKNKICIPCQEGFKAN